MASRGVSFRRPRNCEARPSDREKEKEKGRDPRSNAQSERRNMTGGRRTQIDCTTHCNAIARLHTSISHRAHGTPSEGDRSSRTNESACDHRMHAACIDPWQRSGRVLHSLQTRAGHANSVSGSRECTFRIHRALLARSLLPSLPHSSSRVTLHFQAQALLAHSLISHICIRPI